MNTLKNIGMKLAGGMIAVGLVGSAFAGMDSVVTVNLPQTAKLGTMVLPSGEYKVTSESNNEGDKLFVFRSDNGESFPALATKCAEPAADQKTEVVLTGNGDGTLHVDKMFIAGESAGYQFDVK